MWNNYIYAPKSGIPRLSSSKTTFNSHTALMRRMEVSILEHLNICRNNVQKICLKIVEEYSRQNIERNH